jgi:hypothetical protein
MHTKYWWEYLNGRDHFGGLEVDGRIILKVSLRNRKGIDCIHLRMGTSRGLL